MRQHALLASLALLLVVGCAQKTSKTQIAESALVKSAPTKPIAGMGVMVGEVTNDGALVQLRVTLTDKLVDRDVPGTEGLVEFALRRSDAPADQPPLAIQQIEATAGRDFIARAAFSELSPGTEYACTTRIGRDAKSLSDGPTATFKTLPGADRAESVQFVVVTGMNYAKFHGDDRIDQKQHLIENNTKLPQPYAGADKHLGYPALASILRLEPDFLIGTGDNVYYDTPDHPRAKTIAEMRQKWHEQFVQPRYVDLFAKVPTYWEVDDHDYRIDDGDNTGDYAPSPADAVRMLHEQLPVSPAGADEPQTYRTHRVSRDLQIWLPENRRYRSANAMVDGPEKTIWGAKQKAWLKKTLLASDATFKLLVSPTPMIGPDDARKTDNHANLGGFGHERDEFFSWLAETGLVKQDFFLVCGDRHWQYHAIDPRGVEEFACGALIDANSRLGRKPGDPKSTDPDGKIKQVYAQTERSGGFLLIRVTPASDGQSASLAFRFHDEQGKLLHEHVKRAKDE